MPESSTVIVTIPKAIIGSKDVTTAWLAFLMERLANMFPYSHREVSVGDGLMVKVVYPVARYNGSTEWLARTITSDLWKAFTKDYQ